MPSKSAAQARLMAAAAHNPEFAKKVGIPTKVAREFNQADKGRKFKEGGSMATKKLPPFMGKESSKEEKMEKKLSAKAYARGERAEGEKGYARGGGIESKGKTKGTMVAMKKGGRCK